MTYYFDEAFLKDAKNKKATYGPDVDLDSFCTDVESSVEYTNPESLPQDVKDSLLHVGLDVDNQNRAGTYFQNNNKVDFCNTKGSGVLIMPIYEALEKFDWLKDYMWKLVKPDTDKYTAEVAIEKKIQGYFIYAPKGVKEIFPLQSCLFTQIEGFKQLVHNIIIAEEDAELNIISGCTIHGKAQKALHLGMSEFYIKKNAKISFTMVHNWAKATEVRPRTVVSIDEGGTYINNYIVMSPVKSLQTNPKFFLNGKNSHVYSQTLVYGKDASFLDIGGEAYLYGENSTAELVSRIVATDTAEVMSRAKIEGKAKGVKGHIDCNGLLISEGSIITAIPILDARNPDIKLTHEAAVGKISQEEIEYLLARGLSEEDARGLIIRGFLEANTTNLPITLAKETERLIAEVADSEMA